MHYQLLLPRRLGLDIQAPATFERQRSHYLVLARRSADVDRFAGLDAQLTSRIEQSSNLRRNAHHDPARLKLPLRPAAERTTFAGALEVALKRPKPVSVSAREATPNIEQFDLSVLG
jgi:hypothetical protein